jgi:hypothetical protein
LFHEDPHENYRAESQTRQKPAGTMTPRDFAAKDGFVRQAKLVALEEETEAIHFANMLYWNYDAHSDEADLEHQRRQKRLSQVRKEYGSTIVADGSLAGRALGLKA